MTQGLQLIRAIIENGSREIFRTLEDRFFTEDERPAWNFVTHYFDRHGGLPSIEAVYEQGFMLPPTSGAISYHHDMLRDRVIYSTYLNSQSRLQEYLRQSDYPAFVSALEAMVAEMRSVETRRDTFTMQRR